MIARKDQKIIPLIPNVDSSEAYHPLLSVVFKSGLYWVYHSKSLNDDSFKNHADQVWRIVKYENHEDRKVNTFRVAEGDVIKFGRVRFRVKKLVVDPNDIESFIKATTTHDEEP